MSEPKDELTPAEFTVWQRALWSLEDALSFAALAEGAHQEAQGRLKQASALLDQVKVPIIRAHKMTPADSLDPHEPAIKRGAR